MPASTLAFLVYVIAVQMCMTVTLNFQNGPILNRFYLPIESPYDISYLITLVTLVLSFIILEIFTAHDIDLDL